MSNDRSRPPVRSLLDPVHLFACGSGAGWSPWAPGTFGTRLAVPLAWLMIDWPMPWRAAVVAVVVLAGIWLCGASATRLGSHDHPAIVLDEIAAMLLGGLALPKHAGWLARGFTFVR